MTLYLDPMNLRVITCLAIPLVLCVTGCQRNFLPSSFADPPAINPLVKKLEIEKSIAAAQRILASPAANWNFGDLSSGDAQHDTDSFNVLNSQLKIERKKAACLEGIEHVNDALRLINDTKLYDEVSAALQMAELRFLRGHFSFELQRIADLMPSLAVSAGALKAKPSWTQIEADFKAAAIALPVGDVPQLRKPGRFAAWAYLAKTYLYQKKWAEAITAADQVINHGGYSLMPEFAEVFVAETDKNSEIVFAIQYEADVQPNVVKEDRLVASRELVNYYKTDDMGLPMHNQDGITAADLIDPRLTFTMAKQGELDNRHFYVIRYADVLLWKAEAAIELANYETGRQLINQVRRRARDGKKIQKAGPVTAFKVAEYTTLFDCYECAIDALKDERRLELALEGHRYFDLLRWGGI